MACWGAAELFPREKKLRRKVLLKNDLGKQLSVYPSDSSDAVMVKIPTYHQQNSTCRNCFEKNWWLWIENQQKLQKFEKLMVVDRKATEIAENPLRN